MELLLLTGEACNKCAFIEPHLAELCKSKGYKFTAVNALEYKGVHRDEIVSLPTLIISQDLVDDIVLDYDQILGRYQNNK